MIDTIKYSYIYFLAETFALHTYFLTICWQYNEVLHVKFPIEILEQLLAGISIDDIFFNVFELVT